MAEEESKYTKQKRMLTEAKHKVIYVVLIFSLLAYSVFATLLIYRDRHRIDATPTSRPQYLPSGIKELYDFVTETRGVCYNPTIVPGTDYREGENQTLSGHEGTYICLDGIPTSPDFCRMYSFGFNRDDIRFETQMGKRGCRMHLVSGITEYSYSQLGNNVYLYPLNLSNFTGIGKYTLDNFINLMNHMGKPIHYVKTTEKDLEWTLLQNIFTSEYKAHFHIKQLRLLLHLPLANDQNLDKLNEMYRLLLGLEYYGYTLLYSRPIPGTIYFHYNLDRNLASKYETVWVRR